MTKEEIIKEINSFRNIDGRFNGRKIYLHPEFIEHINSFPTFLSKESSYKEKIYAICHDLTKMPRCKECNKEVTFNQNLDKYPDYCSPSCVAKGSLDKRKKTNLKKYGCEHPSQSKIVKEKKCHTNLKNRGVDNPFKSEEVINQIKKTNINKFGNENFFGSDIGKKQIKQISLDKYGYENPMQNTEIQNKHKKNFKKRYGVDNPSQLDSVKEKKIETFSKNWGVDHYMKSKRLTDNNFNKLLQNIKSKNMIALFTKDEYTGRKKEYMFQCEKCGKESLIYFNQTAYLKCPHCYPMYKSGMEEEVSRYLQSISISFERNYRLYYDGYRYVELDFYLSDYNFAIEMNGNYWHSELNGRDSTYHLHKFNICIDNNINLIQFWENEWNLKQDICKSMILSKLGININRIYARKCTLTEVSSKTAKKFLEDNHLQGFSPSTYYFGLINNNELVSLCSFKKSRFDKKAEWEIIRFSTKKEVQVVGGFSKILSYFKNRYSPTSIITYANKRYSIGKVYETNNFIFLHDSKPSYWYVHKNAYNQPLNRLNFQKSKLEKTIAIFDPKLTEWENMKLNSYDRIWDCGNKVYIWKSN